MEPNATYQLESVWVLRAAVDDVRAVMGDVATWPEWWEGMVEVEVLEPGDRDSRGSLQRAVVRGALPYRLRFRFRVEHVDGDVVEGRAVGGLDGNGRFVLEQHGPFTTVRCDWRVRTTKLWLRLLAPIARPLMTWNHHLAMRRGGEGLARRLEADLLSARSRRAR